MMMELAEKLEGCSHVTGSEFGHWCYGGCDWLRAHHMVVHFEFVTVMHLENSALCTTEYRATARRGLSQFTFIRT
jgi:predicted glycosyl hydrolase (DUF1957 family)